MRLEDSPDVVVESRGGVIVAIYTRNSNARVVVVDWDDISASCQYGVIFPLDDISGMPIDTATVANAAR